VAELSAIRVRRTTGIAHGYSLAIMILVICLLDLTTAAFRLPLHILVSEPNAQLQANSNVSSSSFQTGSPNLTDGAYLWDDFLIGGKAGMRLVDNWKNEMACDEDSVQLIAGVNIGYDGAVDELSRIAEQFGGKRLDLINETDVPVALVVDVPINQVRDFRHRLQELSSVRYVQPNMKTEAEFIPNDPLWSSQWGPQKIEADLAWETTTGDHSVLVAIVDTGIEYTHPELTVNYVSGGHDWVNNDDDPMDDNGHGTHCAGIVAAQANNGLGIAGIAQVRLMAEKVLGADGTGYDSWVANGIYHAVDSGARIISMSLGGDADSTALHDAVKYAYMHGVLVVAAAGNSGSDQPHYPACYDEVMAVSATDSSDSRAAFSSYGEWVDLAAPGLGILSTYRGASYTEMSGTSMACPHVTGVAGLVWTMFPNYTLNQVRTTLQRSADDLGYPGFDQYFGYGRVNARKAILGLQEHDIALARWWGPGRINPGEEGTFDTVIANNGLHNESNVTVEFFVNGTLTDLRTVDLLENGTSVPLSFSWGTSENGVYNMTCYLIPVAGENFTENNAAYLVLQVRPSRTLRIPTEFPAIKTALQSAGDGDTILVAGAYFAEGEIDVTIDNVALIAEGRVQLEGCGVRNVIRVEANGVLIEGFDIINCTSSDYAVYIRGSNNTLRENVFYRNGECVQLMNSFNCNVTGNIFRNNGGNGLVLQYTCNTEVSGNSFVSQAFLGGINLWTSSNNSVLFNNITGGTPRAALDLWYSEGNILRGNRITDNEYGLVIQSSPNNIFRNNVMLGNTRNLCIGLEDVERRPEKCVNDLDTSNTINGKPIYYLVDVCEMTVPSNAGCVVLVRCRNIRIEDVDIRNNLDGILLLDTNNSLIRGSNISGNTGGWWEPACGGITLQGKSSRNNVISSNHITHNRFGVLCFYSGGNDTITMNEISDNGYGVQAICDNTSVSLNNVTCNGVYLTGSSLSLGGVEVVGSNCSITSNNIMSNQWSAVKIKQGERCMVTDNNIIANGVGSDSALILSQVTQSTISSNNFIETAGTAIVLDGSGNNTFFRNNFINNTLDVQSNGINTWNLAYPEGGNYWSCYNGTDTKSGPFQNITGPDGIGDTSYCPTVNETDQYPRMTSSTDNPLPQTYKLELIAWLNNEQIAPPSNLYDNTPDPAVRTWLFLPNMTVTIDCHAYTYTDLDHWELDGVVAGFTTQCTVKMNSDHALKAFFVSVEPVTVAIAPTETIETKVNESIQFKSLISGGKLVFWGRRIDPWLQWHINDSFVFDAALPTWTFTPNAAGTYIVNLAAVTQSSTLSNNVTVNVKDRPQVYVLPTSHLSYSGEPVELTSTFGEATPPYRFEWFMNGTKIIEATSSTLTYVPTEPGTYRIHFNVIDSAGTTRSSDEATITVMAKPSIYISPTAASIRFPQPLVFTANATNGYKPYRIRWVLDQIILNCTATSVDLTRYPSGNHSLYVNLTDILATTVKSNEVSITVKPELKLSVNPEFTAIVVGKSIELTAVPFEDGLLLTYQWFLNDQPVVGATSHTWNFTPQTGAIYTVYANVTEIESELSAKSNVAKVTVYFLGDVNHDWRVDMRDIGAVCSHFGATPSEPNWDPLMDLNEDLKVDMRDIGIACRNFGKHYP